jgi:hypothetical protein
MTAEGDDDARLSRAADDHAPRILPAALPRLKCYRKLAGCLI